MKVKVTIASRDELEHCLAIRHIVFVEGQNVAPDLEIDGLDGEAIHFLISLNDIYVGCARVRYLDKKAKIERVAILPKYQGRGLGKELMTFIMENIANARIAKMMVLSSQINAIPFYESLGFIVCSAEYLDANILHKDMKIEL